VFDSQQQQEISITRNVRIVSVANPLGKKVTFLVGKAAVACT